MADFLESNLFRPTAPREPFFKKPKRKKIKVDEDLADQEAPRESPPLASLGVASLAASHILDQHATKQKKAVATNGLVRIPGPPSTLTRTKRRNVPSNAPPSGHTTKESRSTQRATVGRSRSFRAKKIHDYENVSLRRNSIVGLQMLKMLAERESGTGGEADVASVCQVLEQFNKMNLVQEKTKQAAKEDKVNNAETSKSTDNTLPQIESARVVAKGTESGQGSQQASETSGKKSLTSANVPKKPSETCKESPNNNKILDTAGEDHDLHPCTKHTKKKRKKLIRLLRLLLGLSWRRKNRNEDKQFLVDEEVTQDDENTRGGAKKSNLSKKVSFRTKHCIDDQMAGSRNEPSFLVNWKRRPRKKTMRRASRRVKKSLGRGCRYIGTGLANMTAVIPEASYMGPITPYRDFDDEYITNDYI